ncbi:MAG: FtsW/RodA/SpoVE family cell cycle protein [Deltaproteobacteria bacterium]|nr:FtsW/RodA/SpoVE family cell cycle protein [Deltaproteobacteria bacterium]
MLTVDRRSVQNFDWTLVGLVAVLATFGLVNLVSATAAGVEGGMSDIVRRQMAAMALGAGFVVVAAFVDYRHVERFAPVLFAGTLALLALTLIVGSVTRGAQAWLYQGSFQPSELAKIGLVIMLARWLHRNPPSTVTQLRQLFVPLVITALPVGLILLQRDMGVALLTLLVALTYLPLCHIPMRAWWGMAFLAAGALTLLWKFGLKVYQQQRILDFMDPSRDPLSSGADAAALLADPAHGLRVQRFGRGVGLDWHHPRADLLLCNAALGTLDRAQLEGRLRRDAGRRAGGDALLAGRDQHRDGTGPGPRHRRAPPALFLRRLSSPLGLNCTRVAAQRFDAALRVLSPVAVPALDLDPGWA